MRSLDIHTRIPEEMADYLENYGFHFSKKAMMYALKDTKKTHPSMEIYTKEQVDEVLKKHGIPLKNNTLYDATYKYNKERANHFGKSITTEQCLAMHIQEDLDSGMGEETFREWVADRIGEGNPIDWYSLL